MHRLLAMGAPEYLLIRKQWVPRTIEEVFPFFDNPHNLPRITPPWLSFRITNMTPDIVGVGTLISYRLRWFGIPYRWRTLITDWIPEERFVDTQLNGPYILWHHTHTFTSHQAGVFMTDQIRYRLPFGPIGVLMHHLLIQRQVEAIFDYRAQRIAELLADGKVLLAPMVGNI